MRLLSRRFARLALAVTLLSAVLLTSDLLVACSVGVNSPSVVPSLQPLQALAPSVRLISPNKRFAAELLRDGRLVVVGSGSRVVWSNGVTIPGADPRLVLEPSGDLVEYSHAGGSVVWSSGSKSVPAGLQLVVVDNGELVVSSSLSPAWSSTMGDIPQVLSVVSFGDSEGWESDQFLRSALSDTRGVVTSFTSNDFAGVSVCDWVENGAMATAVNADVVALFFVGDGFTPCTDPSDHRSPLALDNLTVADMGAAIKLLLSGHVQHILVVSPVPGAPHPVLPLNYLATRLEAMVNSLHNPRVSYVSSTSLSISPTGAFPTTMPCTELEIAGRVCQGPVIHGVRTNRVIGTNGHFCMDSLTNNTGWKGPGAHCPGFQPGAWRWANAEAEAILAPYGLPFRETLQSGFAS